YWHSPFVLPDFYLKWHAYGITVTLSSDGRPISFSWCVKQTPLRASTKSIVTRIVRIVRINTDKEHIG
ncbi:MAG: hypothetical protein M0R69_09455, partial [Candidatus Cloacimonetes bacterium]|nr:hypothetical protein [Candidatus Cloacimonadota bacterium]